MLLAAIALSTAVKYVAAAYGVVWLLILLYVWILRSKYERLEAMVETLEREVGDRPDQRIADEQPERITVS
jgi:CcmD family protein